MVEMYIETDAKAARLFIPFRLAIYDAPKRHRMPHRPKKSEPHKYGRIPSAVDSQSQPIHHHQAPTPTTHPGEKMNGQTGYELNIHTMNCQKQSFRKSSVFL